MVRIVSKESRWVGDKTVKKDERIVLFLVYKKLWNRTKKFDCHTKCHARFFYIVWAITLLRYGSLRWNFHDFIRSLWSTISENISVRKRTVHEKNKNYCQYVTRDFVIQSTQQFRSKHTYFFKLRITPHPHIQ